MTFMIALWNLLRSFCLIGMMIEGNMVFLNADFIFHDYDSVNPQASYL